jgi:hypothetical protein
VVVIRGRIESRPTAEDVGLEPDLVRVEHFLAVLARFSSATRRSGSSDQLPPLMPRLYDAYSERAIHGPEVELQPRAVAVIDRVDARNVDVADVEDFRRRDVPCGTSS